MSKEMPRNIKVSCAHKSKWLEIERHEYEFGDLEKTYDIVIRSDCAIVIVMDDKNNTVIIEQYRYPVNSATYGFPMGGIDSGESPEEAAKRELKEEVGILVGDLDLIGEFNPVPGLSPQIAYVYIARVHSINSSGFKNHESDEEIYKIEVVPFSNIDILILEGRMTDGYSLSAAIFTKVALKLG